MRSFDILNEDPNNNKSKYWDYGKDAGLDTVKDARSVDVPKQKARISYPDKVRIVYQWKGAVWEIIGYIQPKGAKPGSESEWKNLSRAYPRGRKADKRTKSFLTNWWRNERQLPSIDHDNKGNIRYGSDGKPITTKEQFPSNKIIRLKSIYPSSGDPEVIINSERTPGRLVTQKDLQNIVPKVPDASTGRGTPSKFTILDPDNIPDASTGAARRPAAAKPNSTTGTATINPAPINRFAPRFGAVQYDLFDGYKIVPNVPEEYANQYRDQFSKKVTADYDRFKDPRQGELDGVRYTDQRSKWQQAWQSSAKWRNPFVIFDFVYGFAGFVKLHTDLELYYRGRFVPVTTGPVDMTNFRPPCEQIKDGTYDPSNDDVLDVYRTNQDRIRMRYVGVDSIRKLANMNKDQATVFFANWAGGTVKNPMKVVELSKSYVASMATNPYTFGVRAQQVAADAIGGLLTTGVAITVIKAVAVICTLAGVTVVGFIPAVIMGILTIGSVLAISFLLRVAFANDFIIDPLAGIISQIWMSEVTTIDNIEKACNKPTIDDVLDPMVDWSNEFAERMATDIENKMDAFQGWAADNLPRTIRESVMPEAPKEDDIEAKIRRYVSPNDIKALANGLTQVYNEFENESESNPEFAKILKRAQEEAKRIGSPGFGVAKDVAARRSAIAQNLLDPDTAPEFKPAEIGDRL